MKNKLLSILLIATVSLGVVACSSNEKPAEQPAEQNIEESSANNQETKGIDKNLEGIELVNSLDSKRPDKLVIKSEMTAFGTTTKMATYYDADKTRTEVDTANMPKSILIHIPSDGVMYSYVEGETQGYKMIGADTTYAEEMGLMFDDSSLLKELVEASSNDMSARVENLDGEEVVYIEATETDEEIGNMLVKMWYSSKYGTPLKYEVVVGETTMMALNVTEISDNEKIDKSLFEPPTDVNFEEMSMEKMMENW